MVVAAASSALDITTEGVKRGWYDGGSIALAVFVVTVVTAISDCRQSLQFRNLSEEKQNTCLEVVRGGRRVKVSIFDVVVGDIVPLKIGDQVPAYGILVSGYSLGVDKSSMTVESMIVSTIAVHKDSKAPFLISGCKVADGCGTILACLFNEENDDGQGLGVSFKKAIEDMAARSLHCVAIAYRPRQTEGLPTSEELCNLQLPERQLILLAIVGIK
ncbi:hypothetical protein ACH5RR_039893, partial [Cinchona calisaya]